MLRCNEEREIRSTFIMYRAVCTRDGATPMKYEVLFATIIGGFRRPL